MEKKLNLSTAFQVTEVELIYRPVTKMSELPYFTNSGEVYRFLLEHWDHDKLLLLEQFKVLLINHGCRLLSILDLSTGSMTATLVDLRLLYAAALKAAATRIIVAHNHPSGQLRPSTHDELLTERIKAAGDILDIQLEDHLIVSNEGYYSFNDEGLL